MKKVRLESGINLEVRDSATNNMELLDELVALQEGDGSRISPILNYLLEKDEKKKLYDHLRVDGIVSVTAVSNALNEIFGKLGDSGKN